MAKPRCPYLVEKNAFTDSEEAQGGPQGNYGVEAGYLSRGKVSDNEGLAICSHKAHCSHMEKDKSFRLRITAGDLERWRREAHGKPLAEWIREKCNRGDIAAVDALQQRSEVIEEPTGKVYAPAAAVVKRVAKCPHRKEKGELCYKCDQKWGFPCLTE